MSRSLRSLCWVVSWSWVAVAPVGCQPLPPPVYVVAQVPEPHAVPGPPPLSRLEVPPPAPDPQHVWLDGYWHWDGQDYDWIPGQWVDPGPGYEVVPATYEVVDGRWHYRPCHRRRRPRVPAPVIGQGEPAPRAGPRHGLPGRRRAPPATARRRRAPPSPSAIVSWGDRPRGQVNGRGTMVTSFPGTPVFRVRPRPRRPAVFRVIVPPKPAPVRATSGPSPPVRVMNRPAQPVRARTVYVSPSRPSRAFAPARPVRPTVAVRPTAVRPASSRPALRPASASVRPRITPPAPVTSRPAHAPSMMRARPIAPRRGVTGSSRSSRPATSVSLPSAPANTTSSRRVIHAKPVRVSPSGGGRRGAMKIGARSGFY